MANPKIGLPDSGYLWFHGASLGELRALSPLIRLFADDLPLVITSTSPGAMRAPALPAGALRARFWDNPSLVKGLLSGARALVVAETELWPNMLLLARQRRIPCFLVNGRVGRATHRWKLFPALLERMLRCFTEIYPKDRAGVGDFARLGAPAQRVVFLGGLKFDALGGGARARRRDFGLAEDLPLVVLGSVRSGEFRAVARAAAAIGKAQVVIAPRHMNRIKALTKALRKRGVGFWFRSAGIPGEGVLVLDTHGELQSLYSISDIAFVGGTLAPYGGHNILEPAALGVPVLFGPHIETQAEEAAELLRAGGALLVRGPGELARGIRALLENEGARREMGQRARAMVQANRGAAGRIRERINRILGL